MFTSAKGGKDMTNSKQPQNISTLHSNDRVLRWPEVQNRVGLCRSHVHNLVIQGKFPSPIKLGERASGWLEREITEWLESRILTSRTAKEVI